MEERESMEERKKGKTEKRRKERKREIKEEWGNIVFASILFLRSTVYFLTSCLHLPYYFEE